MLTNVDHFAMHIFWVCDHENSLSHQLATKKLRFAQVVSFHIFLSKFMAQFRAQIRIEGLRGLEVYGCNGPLGEDPVRGDHKRFILIKEKQLATKYY